MEMDVKFKCQTCAARNQKNMRNPLVTRMKWVDDEFKSLTMAMKHLSKHPTHDVEATVDVEVHIS